MNLLFVCSENKLRSPTGEEVFSQYEGVQAIGCGTNLDAETPKMATKVRVIFFFEE